MVASSKGLAYLRNLVLQPSLSKGSFTHKRKVSAQKVETALVETVL
jgi:hypothetical protein